MLLPFRWPCGQGFLLILALGSIGCDTPVPEEIEAPRVGRGATLSVTQVEIHSAEKITSDLQAIGVPLSARFSVAIYRLVYETVDPFGAVTRASGALLIPTPAAHALPLVSYQHGTIVQHVKAPSLGGAERLIGLIFAADGYMAAMPDLLGLGDSPGLHPYLHAAASASAVIDMLRATVDFAAANERALNGKLFLAGYSQGGYTAMAAHRVLESEYADEFVVTASAPMAGPYDLSGVMAEVVLGHEPYPSPYFLPYTLLAYNAIYRLFERPSDYLTSPYDTQIPPLFDGGHSAGEINSLLPSIPRNMVRPEVLAAFESDPNHPFRTRLRENNVYDWAPSGMCQRF